MDSTPIHNECIKQFNWKLWYGDNGILPKIDTRDKFTAPETIIEASAVETFCPVVGNRGKSFKTVRNSDVKAPMDITIITGWQVSLLIINTMKIVF
jgi:fatty acid synthase subunit beta